MKRDLFQYPTPFTSELEDMYYPKHKVTHFSPELIATIHYIFTHPHTKYHTMFYNHINNNLIRDMIKPAYLLCLYYLDHPQQYKHELSNIADAMIVRMWRVFVKYNKNFNHIKFNRYLATDMRMLDINGIHFAEQILSEITNKKMIIVDSEQSIKHRNGKTLRQSDRASLKENGSYMKYLCSLE